MTLTDDELRKQLRASAAFPLVQHAVGREIFDVLSRMDGAPGDDVPIKREYVRAMQILYRMVAGEPHYSELPNYGDPPHLRLVGREGTGE